MASRRSILKMGLYGGSLLLLPRCVESEPVGGAPVGTSRSGVGFVQPLRIPPVLTPTSSDATTDYYDITQSVGSVQVRAVGPQTPIWGFNGIWPGPTLKATRGRRVVVRQNNQLSERTTVHNHGLKVAASSDGHPVDYIEPQTIKTFDYPNDQNAATLWYHAHTMDVTAPQVYNGLAGFYLLTDDTEQSLNLPSGNYDVPLLLQDRSFNPDNTLRYQPDNSNLPFLGNVMCVNGVETPHFRVARRKYRFRILNGCNSRFLTLRLSSGSFTQIGADSSLLRAPVSRTTIRIAPAERVDCVINFANYSLGSSVRLLNDDTTAPQLPEIMRFDIDRNESDTSTVPSQLITIPTLPQEGALTRNIVLGKEDGPDGAWTINGQQYDPARIDIYPKLDTVEIWNIQNDSPADHPFHQHLVPFQILDIDGVPPGAGNDGWKDVVLVPAGSTARIIMRFEGFTGVYVAHCHILEHEDHRMMMQQQVTT